MSITFSGVTFHYPFRDPVFDDLTVELGSGSTILLGPNGAGKSTLLGLGASALRLHRGSISCRGLSPRGRELRHYRSMVGWMPQVIRPIARLTAREQVAYVGWLKGMSRSDAWDRARSVLVDVGLEPKQDVTVGELSGGQIRRVGVAQTLVHESKLLLMDEPTAGLDPAQRGGFRTLLAKLRERGVDMVVSTHDTADIEESFDHVVVLADSRVRFQGSTTDFLGLAAGDTESLRGPEAAYRAALAVSRP